MIFRQKFLTQLKDVAKSQQTFDIILYVQEVVTLQKKYSNIFASEK